MQWRLEKQAKSLLLIGFRSHIGGCLSNPTEKFGKLLDGLIHSTRKEIQKRCKIFGDYFSIKLLTLNRSWSFLFWFHVNPRNRVRFSFLSADRLRCRVDLEKQKVLFFCRIGKCNWPRFAPKESITQPTRLFGTIRINSTITKTE